MKYRHHHDQLQYFCRERGWRSLSSSVKVIARTRSPDRKSGFSACIEIINMDKQTIRMIVPARKIMGGTNYQLRDELFDTGFGWSLSKLHGIWSSAICGKSSKRRKRPFVLQEQVGMTRCSLLRRKVSDGQMSLTTFLVVWLIHSAWQKAA